MDQSYCLVSPALDPQVRKLVPGIEYVIGRDAEAQIQLVSDRVSHKHAKISWSGSEFVVEDLGSKNGFSVDGEITKRKPLRDGELIRLGPFSLRFRMLTGDVEGVIAGVSSAVVSGRFAEGELVDLASVIQLRRLTGRLRIDFEGGQGTLTVDKGSLVSAQHGHKKGLDAAEQILRAATGSFEFRAASQVERGDLSLPFADLLIQIIGSGHRPTRTIESAGDVSGDLLAVRARLQTARAELDLANVRAEFGNLFGAILFVLFVYSMALTLLQSASAYRNVVNPIATAAFTVVMIRQLVRSTYPLRTFGLTLENWRRSLFESLMVTLPVLVLMLLARLAFHDVLEPGRPIANFDLDARFFAYPLIVPLQEVMSRGAVQTSLQRFLIGKSSTLRAILLTSALFGLVHMHISLAMSFTTIILSIGWGLLYARHRTLVGVTVSHLLIGVFGFALWGGLIPGWQ